MKLLFSLCFTLMSVTAYGSSIDSLFFGDKEFHGQGEWNSSLETTGTWDAVYNFNDLDRSGILFKSILNVDGANFSQQMTNELTLTELNELGAFLILKNDESIGSGLCLKSENGELSCELELLHDSTAQKWTWLLSASGDKLTEHGSMTKSHGDTLEEISWTGEFNLIQDESTECCTELGCEGPCDDSRCEGDCGEGCSCGTVVQEPACDSCEGDCSCDVVAQEPACSSCEGDCSCDVVVQEPASDCGCDVVEQAPACDGGCDQNIVDDIIIDDSEG